MQLEIGYYINLGVCWVQFILAENYDIRWYEAGFKDLPKVTYGNNEPASKMRYDRIRFTEDDPFIGLHAAWSDSNKFSIT